jgi:hypothetical protein
MVAFIIDLIPRISYQDFNQTRHQRKSSMEMPAVDLEVLCTKLTQQQMNIATQIFSKRNNIYRVRASKPKYGPSAYVWRMIVFTVSTNPQHHCIPVGADFYINDTDFAHRTDQYIPRDPHCETVKNWDTKTWNQMHKGEKRRQYIKQELDPIVDIITETIPKSQWRGAHRWHKAFYG